jgi:hypothetical protein
MLPAALALALLTLAAPARKPAPAPRLYSWEETPARTLEAAFPAPAGFTRVALPKGSFGEWLRTLPLRAEGTPVHAFNGETILAADDARLAAVSTLDVGKRDLQQCADAAIRLHAEWLWTRGRALEVSHPLTNGDVVPFARWAKGERPSLVKNKVVWAATHAPDASYAAFRAYLDFVFMYAGTLSLAHEAQVVKNVDARPGDMFVASDPRSIGHAVVILDLARDDAGHRVALIGQSSMPAQDFHVVADRGTAWFSLDGETVETPFWDPFPWTVLRRLDR